MISLIASLSLLVGLALRTHPEVGLFGLDNNDFAHFFGAFGLVTLLLLALAREVRRPLASGGLAGLVGVTAFSFVVERWFSTLAIDFQFPYWAIAWHFLILAVVYALCCRGLEFAFPSHANYVRWPLLVVLSLIVLQSLGWELVWQPWFVPARGYVQWWQLLADQLGCGLAWLLLRQVAFSPKCE